MSETIEFYQGDSSDIISITVFSRGVQVTGVDLDTFTGVFSVMKKLGGTPLLEKNMTAVDDAFRTSISPEESEALGAGNYIGVTEINDGDGLYRKETHVNIKITKQGIPD